MCACVDFFIEKGVNVSFVQRVTLGKSYFTSVQVLYKIFIISYTKYSKK